MVILISLCTKRCGFFLNQIFKHDACINQKTIVRSFNTSFKYCGRVGKNGPKEISKKIQIEEPMGFIFENSGNSEGKQLIRPLLFTAAFSTASFVGATIWQYENIKHKAKVNLQWMHERVHNFKVKQGKFRNDINRWWKSLSDAEKIFIPICLLNVLVFMAWRIPSMQSTMIKYFCSNPSSNTKSWPMLLSAFSHYSAFHIFANMYVLHSFSTGAVMNLGKEQFLGFYLSAAVISSFASYVHKIAFNKPGLSLGASGAIMAVLAYTCSQYPDIDLSIIFLPFFTFKAGLALKVIMGIDTMGILLGWKLFDHAAHLGGALFGLYWAYYGNQHLWRNRKFIIEKWEILRTTRN